MALYEKKLHIRKNGVVTDINLWTESGEAGTPALRIRDGVNLVHARLGEVTDGLASDLRVRKDNVVYAVLKNRWVTINIVQSANQTITVTAGEKTYTESFSVPYGTAYTATVTAVAGFTPGALSSSGGTAEGDVTISATAAVTTVPTGSVNGDGVLNFTIPSGVSVVRFLGLGRIFFVGVRPGETYLFYCCEQRADNGTGGDNMYIANAAGNVLELVASPAEGDYSETSLPFTISYGPEINAHGPTDGSI